MLILSRIDSDDPKVVIPYTDNELPRRAKDRRDSDELREIKSRIDMDDPRNRRP